jgi:hypothetical protein
MVAMHDQEETVRKQATMGIKTVDVEKIADAGAEQLSQQYQLVREMSRNTVALPKQEKIIEDQQGIAANTVYDRSIASGPTRHYTSEEIARGVHMGAGGSEETPLDALGEPDEIKMVEDASSDVQLADHNKRITTSRSQQADHRQAGAEGPQTSHHLVGAGQSRPDLGDGQDTEHHLGGAGQDMQQHRAVMQQRPIQQHTTVLVVVLQGDIVNAHGLV